MRHTAKLFVTACMIAVAAPAAVADVSSAKGKRICKVAGEAEVPGGKARVNSRDIRATDTTRIYQVRLIAADGAQSNVVCVVDKESGEATLTPVE